MHQTRAHPRLGNELTNGTMETRNAKPENIKGWGIDADVKNDPTYPMKARQESTHSDVNWERPAIQKPRVEVLKSVERPTLSAIVGEAAPPEGLSGCVRRFAYRYSENEFSHWIPLLLADRINVWEGIIADIKAGSFPNILKERGSLTAWRLDPPHVRRRIAIAGLAVGAWLVYRAWKRRQ